MGRFFMGVCRNGHLPISSVFQDGLGCLRPFAVILRGVTGLVPLLTGPFPAGGGVGTRGVGTVGLRAAARFVILLVAVSVFNVFILFVLHFGIGLVVLVRIFGSFDSGFYHRLRVPCPVKRAGFSGRQSVPPTG